MADQRNGGIAWCDETWNPIRGCSRVSEGCRACYAEAFAARFAKPRQPYHGLAEMTPSGPRWTGKVRLVPEHLADPLKWRKPRRVFVNSMSDLFHEGLKNEEIAAVFGIMAAAPRHTFQVLTKRPERMLEWFCWYDENRNKRRFRHPELIEHAAAIVRPIIGDDADIIFRAANACAGRDSWPLPNVWLGVSVENQKTADERIPLLLQAPAALRWVSFEPALKAVDFSRWIGYNPLYEAETQRGESVRSCHPRLVRDSSRRVGVAGNAALQVQMDRPCDVDELGEAAQDRSSSRGGLSNSSRDGERYATHVPSSPARLASLQRADSSSQNDQSQERREARQQTGQSGSNELFGEQPTCRSCSEAGAYSKPARAEESQSETIDARSAGHTNVVSIEEADAGRTGFRVQCELSDYFKDSSGGASDIGARAYGGLHHQASAQNSTASGNGLLRWIVCGGEAGHGARPFDVGWARSVIEQCREAGVPCFVKQLGSRPFVRTGHRDGGDELYSFRDPKGGDADEWPEDMRVRQFPEVQL